MKSPEASKPLPLRLPRTRRRISPVDETYGEAEAGRIEISCSEFPTLRESIWTQADALQSHRCRVCVALFEFFPLYVTVRVAPAARGTGTLVRPYQSVVFVPLITEPTL